MEPDVVLNMFYGAIVSTLVALLGTVTINAVNRHSRMRDARRAQRSSELDAMRCELRDIVAGVLGRMTQLPNRTASQLMLPDKLLRANELLVAMGPLLGEQRDSQLGILCNTFVGEQASDDPEATKKAGYDLLDWLANL